MTIRQETCPACAAPITVPTEGQRMRCPFCNTSLSIERDSNGIGLELAEQITAQISETVERTGAETLSELERLHLLHGLSNRRLHLAQLQSEIRSLERMRMDGTVRTQLRNLRAQEADVQREIDALEQQLNPDGEMAAQPEMDEAQPDLPVLQRWLWMLFSLSGRTSRMEFWGGIVVVALLFFLVSLFNNAAEASAGTQAVEPLSALLILCALWISLATHVKRLRTRRQSMWWLALWLFPFFGTLWLVIQLGVLADEV